MPGKKPGMTRKTSGVRRQSGLRLFNDRLERGRLVDREIREHLAVDCHAGLGKPIDELGIVQAERTHGGIETLDPQGAERALSPLAVAEGILVRLLDRLLGDADGVLAAAVKT